MHEVDIEKENRQKNFDWFKSFSNSTYGVCVKIDVTNLLNLAHKNHESFFIYLLYITVEALSSVPEMRMRLLNDRPVIYDKLGPAFTVMTETGVFENVRFAHPGNFRDFYQVAHEKIEATKKQQSIRIEEFNPTDRFDEYYITSLPWTNFESFSHPIPDNHASQCVPRVCWGKYVEENGRYILNYNITVSHIFVDGYPLSQALNRVQELIDRASEILQ